ncbi:MAG: FIST C-terminal domain-containing protein [Deltaproteobacteria bacterium]|nr:FIST C-terminal domain-containing protein [Deltaproteobacteria bacterium]
MRIANAWSINPDSKKAVSETYEKLADKLGTQPDLILVHSSCDYDSTVVVKRLRMLAPGVPLQGGTTCMGVMTEEGFHTRDNRGIGMLGISDPNGGYGVGIARFGADPSAAATSALVQAIEEAGRPGELPVAVIMTVCPGNEEETIRAIEAYLGTALPILGGTSADNDMSGRWQQFGNDLVIGDGISVAALFSSGDVGYSFHSGYEPTTHRGKATRASGRVLYEIDDRPAADVYNEWTNGLITDVLPQGGSLVPTATFTPLGNPVGQVGGIPYFRLSYPVEALPDGALQLFTEARQGSEIVLMQGTPESLSTRAGRVATAAVESAPFRSNEVEGAFVLFCAGCMLAVQDRMQEAQQGLKSAFQGRPFLCSFTLGEQGCFIGGENRHGNLMIATLVFGPVRVD